MSTTERPSRVIRVLVVDDSVVARMAVAHAFDREDGLELAGVAANGRLALDKLDRLKPDVVVLDLDMPVMDGFDTLRALHADHPGLPVIVFSHLTARGAAETLDAMALGAAAFATKPSAQVSALDGDHVRNELVPLIKALAGGPAPPDGLVGAEADRTPDRPPGTLPVTRASALVVGASTGGPNALAVIVGALPADLAVPVLIVQHMPAVFTAQLAERLNRLGPLPVVEGESGQAVVPGQVYVAPGGRHMGVLRTGAGVSVVVHDGPPENSCRPAADVLFRAAAQVYGRRLLGLVLTGMGHDGLQGAGAVADCGGTMLAQDQATAVVGSMPGAVADAGLADAVLPLEGIAPELGRRLVRVGHP